ncbi:uncharacterized protein LOC111712753 [Eurytemora carolleeae]|uniref:uncharacterized protein LOC111712753 n=1 Tax=Eurytemora carolleeae TaxID=1294199 RepID=UPI000C77C3BD|nr:uncharacterized protein LOC111712753 [Eurytemora carolleeae]|eukprot:XP_023343230.1 uncharacterized protein LOC111712753 [Eurytemora affinis]
MSGRRLIITLTNPIPPEAELSKDSVARKLRDSSSIFKDGVFFTGSENNGGNAVGALYPLLHLNMDKPTIKTLLERPKKFIKSIGIGSFNYGMVQGVFTELEQILVTKERQPVFETNAIVLLGCKVMESGSRTAKSLEKYWKAWTNINLLKTFILQAKIEVQNISFLRQTSPGNNKMFMYIMLMNVKVEDYNQEMSILDGLQKMRGSIVACYAALYKVSGDLSRSKSEESMENLIEVVSGGTEKSRRRRSKKESRSERRSKSVNTL